MRLARFFLVLAVYSGCSTRPEPTIPKVASDEVSSPPSSDSGEIDTPTHDDHATRESDEESPPEVAEGTDECSGAASDELLAALRNRGAASRQCFEALPDR